MKIQILLGLIVAFVASTDALSCYTCENEPSLAGCIQNGRLRRCQSNENACETHVRRDGNKELYFKTCKQALACVNNEIQNPREAASPVQCNNQGQSSVCRCCCYRDRCGQFTDDCTEGLTTEKTTTTIKPETFCDDPEDWEDGEVNCGDSLPNGLFALRHTCQLICNAGTRLVEGAGNIVTCRVNPSNPSSIRGVWMPDYPECEADPEERCVLPPVWEEGTVSCVDQQQDGGWIINDRCDYICPEGTTLVGNSSSICTENTNSGELFFDPDTPPCCEPVCDPNVPVDVLFILDHSTSIGSTNWRTITRAVSDVIGIFRGNDFINFGVEVYGHGILREKNIRFEKPSLALQLAARRISYSPPDYGTFTVAALSYASNVAFSPGQFGENADAKNIAIFVTDGVSSDNRRIGNTDTLTVAASILHANTEAVVAIGIGLTEEQVQNNDELRAIASDPRLISRIDKFEELVEELRRATQAFCDPVC